MKFWFADSKCWSNESRGSALKPYMLNKSSICWSNARHTFLLNQHLFGLISVGGKTYHWRSRLNENYIL